MASLFYNNFYEELANGNIDLANDTIKCALMTTSYSEDADSHAFFSDLSGEASGSGYTSGGQTLDNVTIIQDNTNDRANIDFDDEVFSSVTVANVNAYVVYKDTGVTSTSPLIAYIEFTEGAQSLTGDLTIQPPAGGAFTIG